jgi:hypothetical protein
VRARGPDLTSPPSDQMSADGTPTLRLGTRNPSTGPSRSADGQLSLGARIEAHEAVPMLLGSTGPTSHAQKVVRGGGQGDRGAAGRCGPVALPLVLVPIFLTARFVKCRGCHRARGKPGATPGGEPHPPGRLRALSVQRPASSLPFWRVRAVDRAPTLAAMRAWAAPHGRWPTRQEWKWAAPGRPATRTIDRSWSSGPLSSATIATTTASRRSPPLAIGG